MRPLLFLSVVWLAALTGCGRSETEVRKQAGEIAAFDVKEAPPPAEPNAGTANVAIQSEPQIAYSYTYGYRLAEGTIDTVQTKHIALCDKLGRGRCRIGSMQRSSSDGEFPTAGLTLFVDARIARGFGNNLDKVAIAEGGENSERGIEAEDLSKQIIDIDARIKAKQALAHRLLKLIEGRAGSVADLVAAERAFADAQEELDAARSSIADLRGRVSMSKIAIKYDSQGPSGSGFWRPVRDAFAAAGQLLGGSVGALVTFVIVAVPWMLLLAALVSVKRRMGWHLRMPWRRKP